METPINRNHEDYTTFMHLVHGYHIDRRCGISNSLRDEKGQVLESTQNGQEGGVGHKGVPG